MAALIVNGDTLGQKQRNYNILVNEAIQVNPTQQLAEINYEDSDLDNLFKIDIACKRRNVKYILDVLKCEDMLYVSRVIKQSTWLITDKQYVYIINPEYLHNQLQPHMTPKAFNKLILHIRLNLKDEKRVEEFFNYYEQRDLKKSLKWLLHCSVPFTENVIRKNANNMPTYLLKRLYEKSFTILEILLRNYTAWHYKDHLIKPGKFLLNRDLEKFLDITESLKPAESISFGQKYTRKVMEKNPARVMNNLEKYVDFLDIPTFAKSFRKEEIKDFILNHIKNKEVTRPWFTYKKIKYFLNRLPSEERFDFVNEVFIEKSYRDEHISKEVLDDIVEKCNLPLKFNFSSSKNIWSWYVYAPFDKAFGDLKQLIRKESNPTERIWILRTMLACAGSDQKNIRALLKYYYENHISEPFKFKVQFVNHLVTKTDTHKYDEESLRYLNDLYNSLELSTRSKDSVETCAKSIILQSVIRGEEIPESIENKFNHEYFIKYKYNECKHKYNTGQREKIFNYFYKYYISKITSDITSEKQFDEAVDIVVQVLHLLEKCNKDLKDFPFILQKIKEFITMQKENSWKCDLSVIYNFKKSWRRILFPESIMLSTTQDTCINALKHDPELLENYRKEINLSINDNVPFNKFLKKIRIDWHRSLADSFKTTFNENLIGTSSQKNSIKGLCTLLPRKELLDFIQKYEPNEVKIAPKDFDNLLIRIRKNIAAYMHLARPHPPFNVALLYAKGDYLQYMHPSLNAIFYNISYSHICEHVAELLNKPVSLQKHGVRVAFSKLNHKELKNIFSEFWKSNKNKSIRNTIFCETYKMLCRERDETVILDVWGLLSTFIDKLHYEENKNIYLTLSKVENIPLSVRAAFWVKSYEFLNKAPAKLNCKILIENLNFNMKDVIEFLDSDFMRTVFLENFDKKFSTQKYDFSNNIALYLLSTKSESVQRERNEKILLPLVEKAIALWDRQHENSYYARNNLRDIFNYMSKEFEDIVLKKEMVFPIAMYTDVLNKLQSTLSIKENYMLITFLKLSLGYIQTLYDLKSKCDDSKDKLDKSKEFTKLYKDAAPIFGRLCLDYLKDDVANWPTIYTIFAHVLNQIFNQYAPSNIMFKLFVLKSFLNRKDFIEGHLLLIELMPKYYHCTGDESSYYHYTEDDEKNLRQEILKEISLHPSEEIAMHYWLARNDDEEFLIN